KGTVIFIGQPAEELILGAEAMVTDGLYTKYGIPQPDYLFGMHSAPFPVGVVAAASGLRQAGTDQFDVTFYGIGGHGSSPHVAKDPIIMAATAIMQYQSIISRGIDPKHSAVITVGSIKAGADNNVIPETTLLKINLRWFDEKDRKLMIDAIKRINEGIAYAYDLPKEKYPTIKFKGFSTPLVNNTDLTKTIQKAVKTIVTDKRFLIDESMLPSVMGSEDFHHLVINNPKKEYCYINIGVSEPKKFEDSFKNGALPFSMHNGNFELDLTAIPFGSKVAITSLLAIFNKKD
ncbi:MAG: amidohydrolase, partial [Ferruginibacter sp.]